MAQFVIINGNDIWGLFEAKSKDVSHMKEHKAKLSQVPIARRQSTRNCWGLHIPSLPTKKIRN